MKSVEQVLAEPTPSTVNYRTDDSRRSDMKDLIDNGSSNRSNAQKTKQVQKKAGGGQKLNWANGVFIPVLLNIWGVIMFLRLGFVVGQAGLIFGSLIIIGANVVTGVTALSLCAICTNGEVQGGGVYFLISRALGPVHGGTIGILFFVAQAVAVSLYVVGFAEAVVDLMEEEGLDYITGSDINDIRVIGLGTVTILFLMSLIGIGWYAKTQTGLLVILIVSILSVYIGAFLPQLPDEDINRQAGFIGFKDISDEGSVRNIGPNFQTDPELEDIDQSFFTVFAVFFPAVTGIMAGANLSGDLDDASKAIPKGTLRAIGVTFVSYMVLLWIVGLTTLSCVNPEAGSDLSLDSLACPVKTLTQPILNSAGFSVPDSGLLYDRLIMKNISIYSYLVYVGVFAATLSSALASLVGAPRILQSVASDKLFPFAWINFFGEGRGAANEPIRGYFLTYIISCGCVSIGKLDLIAPIITNFFMISYAFTNYACFASSSSKAPNWRPSFKYFNKYLSLFGAILCIAVMLAIDWITSVITITVAIGIWFYLKSINPDINWGEAGEAQKYTQALQGLEKLQLSQKEHVKTFRPQFLVMTGNVFSRIGLVKFISMLQGGGGVMICADVINHKQVDTSKVGRTISLDENKATITEMATDSDGSSSVRDLFDKNETDAASSVESSEGAPLETAKELAAEFEFVKQKRAEADAFLNNKTIWGSKRCKGAFYEAIISSSLLSGFQKMLQLGGIGKMRPNAVVVGFKADYLQRSTTEIADYERMLRAALSVQLGLIVVRDDQHVFEINLQKATMSLLHPAFKKTLITTDSSPNEVKKDMDNNFKGIMADEFQEEINTTKTETKPADALQDWTNGGSKSSNEFKERIEKYKSNDLEYIKKFENSLPTDVQGEFIDVWWLADDGGLTMLLPQLLIQNPLFKGKKLRVMAVTNKFQNAEETQRLKKAEFNMVHLLHKFRIEAKTVGIDLKLDQPLNQATKDRFEKCMGMPINELDEQEQIKTHYNMRLTEEMRKMSRNASMVFMILPIPESSLKVKLHTVWLDMFSYDMPPMIMMRGNNENVLTFFC